MSGATATLRYDDNKSYLVELKETAQPSTFTKETGIKPTHLYTMDGFSGFAAYLTENQVIELRSNPQVADVLDDVELELASSSSGEFMKNSGDDDGSGTKSAGNDNEHYVVLLKKPVQVSTFLAETGIEPTRSFDLLHGFSANLTEKQFLELSCHPDVAAIEDDDRGVELELYDDDNKSYLVELKETAQPSTFTKETGIKPIHLYTMDGFSGFAAHLNEKQIIELRGNPQVTFITESGEMELASPSSGTKRKKIGDSEKRRIEPQSPAPGVIEDDERGVELELYDNDKEYIVGLKETVQISTFLDETGIESNHRYTMVDILYGFSAHLTEKQIIELRGNPQVTFIYESNPQVTFIYESNPQVTFIYESNAGIELEESSSGGKRKSIGDSEKRRTEPQSLTPDAAAQRRKKRKTADIEPSGAKPTGRGKQSYFVRLKETAQPSMFTKETGIEPIHLYTMKRFSGFAAHLTESQVIELRSNPQVASVIEDGELELASSSSGKKGKNAGDNGDSGKKKTEPQSPTPDAPARRRKKRKTDVTKPSETEPTGDRQSMASKSTK